MGVHTLPARVCVTVCIPCSVRFLRWAGWIGWIWQYGW